MKYIKQLFIILTISLISEVLQNIVPLPIPTSIYGLVLLFMLLSLGVIREDQIKETADFLLSILGLILVPICVGIIDTFTYMSVVLPALLLIGSLGTIIVMVATGRVAQAIMKNKEAQ